MTARPLHGVRVIDMCTFVAGPTAGRMLAELGADVIRIDPTRGAIDSDRWPVAGNGSSLYWAGLNQAKKSVAVDTRSEAGRALVTELIAESDVLLDNISRAEWLSNTILTERRPDLIHLHIQGNPDGTPAVDYTVNASIGVPLMTGTVDSTAPVNHVLPAWDMITGVHAALGIVAALRLRDTTGAGSYLELALSDVALSGVAAMGWVAEAEEVAHGRPRQGNALYGSYGADFPTADGRSIMVVGLTTGQWKALVDATGTAEVFAALEKQRGLDLNESADRFAARDAITAVVRPWFESRTLSEIENDLAGTRVLWSAYRDLSELAARVEAAEHDSVIQRVVHPGVGSVLTSRPALRWQGKYTDASPSPRHGQHTVDILAASLGLDADEIDALVRSGVIAGGDAS